jgi:6-pyruvoyltetrahydropterin/6-carboxytetrahydropterin synthase
VFRIEKRWAIDCAHQLHGLPAGHKCGRLHGHTYGITITLTARALDGLGMVIDYGALDDIVKAYDHQDWTATLPQPTAEAIAEYLVRCVRAQLDESDHAAVRIERVRVAETAQTYAEWVDE